MNRTSFSKILFAASLALLAAPTPSLAKETNLGKHSQNEIRDACNKAGGELLGVSDLGSYGCDNGKNGGGMVLCNKNNECTGYTEARTKSDIKRIRTGLHLKATSKH
jgi:hypothetical protein